jgi:putative flippase GtrA
LSRQNADIVRYIINGLIATTVHYCVLKFNLEVLNFLSAGLANLTAAVFGIASSFLGSRYFVFRKSGESIKFQAIKFSGFYGLIAILHFLVLFLWNDYLGLDFTFGFLIATALQLPISYLANKFIVFKNEN